ncbi:pyridoxal phosphate-dependent aminotransferase [Campylobacter armoricus]|uniref:pyridoxal phosphate-dependent aminotransferase n=1 Tax=Campylobacter armoricus TaxID=2505970 RepID=UPI0011166377|nr:histidinol-phosphate transaminase [Campylobacter armoricus]
MRLANKNIQELKPYVSIPHKIWELSDKNNILKLDWNEATIKPSKKVSRNIIEYMTSGFLNWYPNTKNTDLLQKIALYTNQLDYTYVEIFGSSDAAHEAIIDVFVDKEKDCIGIVSPTYDNFRARANGVGCKTIVFSLDDNFKLDFKALEVFLSKNKIKMLYLCYPNNPTGMLYDKNQIEQLIVKFPETMFLIDEAYYEFSEQSFMNLTQKYDNFIITRTFSKAFALASFRIGYVISHYKNIEAINKLRNSKNVSMLSQIAAMSALDDLEYMKKYVVEVNKAREFTVLSLKELGLYVYEKSVANFVLIKTEDVSELLKFLETKNIFIRNYSHIIPGHCRVSIGSLEQMKYFIGNVREFYAR